jgi:hypothetical protein
MKTAAPVHDVDAYTAAQKRAAPVHEVDAYTAAHRTESLIAADGDRRANASQVADNTAAYGAFKSPSYSVLYAAAFNMKSHFVE